MGSLRLALSFLTILPVHPPEMKPGDLGRAGFWFPVVGLMIGSLLAVVGFLFSQVFPPILSAALTVTAWAVLTGGMHLDGVADSSDGLFASATPERRLEIMRDPRVGTFGVLSLVFLLLIKIFALASLSTYKMEVGALLLAPVLARWWMLWVARQSSAQLDGLGAEFARGFPLWMILATAWLPLACILLLGERAAIAMLCAGAAATGIIFFARMRLGGVTGDVLGLTIEFVELAVLLGFAAAG